MVWIVMRVKGLNGMKGGKLFLFSLMLFQNVSYRSIHTIQSLLMVTPVALEGWHVKKTDERTQKTQYLLWIYYFIYPIFLLCLARA